MFTCLLATNDQHFRLRSFMPVWLEKYAHAMFSALVCFNVVLQHPGPFDKALLCYLWAFSIFGFRSDEIAWFVSFLLPVHTATRSVLLFCFSFKLECPIVVVRATVVFNCIIDLRIQMHVFMRCGVIRAFFHFVLGDTREKQKTTHNTQQCFHISFGSTNNHVWIITSYLFQICWLQAGFEGICEFHWIYLRYLYHGAKVHLVELRGWRRCAGDLSVICRWSGACGRLGGIF